MLGSGRGHTGRQQGMTERRPLPVSLKYRRLQGFLQTADIEGSLGLILHLRSMSTAQDLLDRFLWFDSSAALELNAFSMLGLAPGTGGTAAIP